MRLMCGSPSIYPIKYKCTNPETTRIINIIAKVI